MAFGKDQSVAVRPTGFLRANPHDAVVKADDDLDQAQGPPIWPEPERQIISVIT